MERPQGSPDSFKSVLAVLTLLSGVSCLLGGLGMVSGFDFKDGLFQVGAGLVVLGLLALYVSYRLGQDAGWF